MIESECTYVMEDTSAGSSVTPPPVRLCDLCRKDPCKYRCPRCSFRTCSLPCSKEHKVKYECSGERDKSFDVLKRLADFSPSVAVEDEKFLNSVTASLSDVAERSKEIIFPDISLIASEPELTGSKPELATETVEEKLAAVNHEENRTDRIRNNDAGVPDGIHDEQQTTSSQMNGGKELTAEQLEWKMIATKRYLLTNAHRRRIWLTVTPEKEGNNSRHEQYSDTIFWTIKMIFRREEKKDEAESRIVEVEYTVNNIPESISMATLLRQFIKPKMVGPVVSKSDLDAEKMAPFQEAGMDKLMVYMPVPIQEKQRFYVIDPSKTILDNLRNRFIMEHPTFIVTLDNQFNDYIMLSEQEAQELRELQRQKNRDESQKIRQNNFRGRGRFDNGRFMSRGRGGGRRGFKRSHDFSDGKNGQESGRPWKFGRPSRGGCYQRRGFHRQNVDARYALESPFAAEGQRPSVPLQTDPIMDAWSKALEVKSKMESPADANSLNNAQSTS